jgi:hypothetical protein
MIDNSVHFFIIIIIGKFSILIALLIEINIPIRARRKRQKNISLARYLSYDEFFYLKCSRTTGHGSREFTSLSEEAYLLCQRTGNVILDT